MTRELGVWTSEDCALVLIDYQQEMFETIRSETHADLAAASGANRQVVRHADRALNGGRRLPHQRLDAAGDRS
jgi:hypothetical protein